MTALAGAAIGSAVTLYTQSSSRRHTDKLALEAKKSALRDDRRDAVYAFIEAGQEVDRHIDAQDQTGHRDDDAARAAMHRMWYRLNCMKVLGNQPLFEAADRLTWRMHCALWEGTPPEYPNVYAFMSEERDKFIAVATQELDLPELHNGPTGV